MVSGLSKRKLFTSIQPFRYDRWNSNQGSGYVNPIYTDNVIQVLVAACGIIHRRWNTCSAEWNTRISGRNSPLKECISRKHKLRVLRRICGPKAEDVSGVRENRTEELHNLNHWINYGWKGRMYEFGMPYVHDDNTLAYSNFHTINLHTIHLHTINLHTINLHTVQLLGQESPKMLHFFFHFAFQPDCG